MGFLRDADQHLYPSKMMKHFWACLCVCAGASLWMACSRKDDGEQARRAAMSYYECLIDGRYEEYVNGIAYSDSMTDVYRSQMVDLVAQFAAREKKAHGGVIAAQALRDTVSGDVASVFLEVLFGDSTREEVVVPMVKCGGEWKMQ